jgi:uncharacterized protein YecE (DUF72 family)
MPRPKQLFDRFDPITADFAYVRWLGDRKGIEEKTKTWNKIIVNRTADLDEWVEVLKKVHERKIQILAFANNHYALCRYRHNSHNADFRIMPNPHISSSPFPLHSRHSTHSDA